MAPILKLTVMFTLFLSTNELEQQLVDTGKKGGTYSFTTKIRFPDYCLFYGPTTEKPLLLWNSSMIMLPENITVTNLQHRLTTVMSERNGPTSLQIMNLMESDSGWYRTESWQNKSVLLAKNIHVYVCETVSEDIYTSYEGETLEVRCEGVRSNDTVGEWFFIAKFGYWDLTNTDVTVLQTKLAETSTSLHIANFSIRDDGQYICLTLDSGRCVHSHKALVLLESLIYYRTLKDKVVLPCFTNDGQHAYWKKDDTFLKTLPLQNNTEPSKMYLEKIDKHYMEDGSVSGNYSLVIFSVRLHQSGVYTCSSVPMGAPLASHELVVCPKSVPFTKSYYEGDKVTLNCSSEIALGSENVLWFRKTGKSEGCILYSGSKKALPWDLKGRLKTSVADNTLVLSDLTLEDSGEYWCAILAIKTCVAEAKTLLIYEPPHNDWDQLVIDSTFNPVYAAVMGSALLVMACFVVAVKVRNKRTSQGFLEYRRNTVELQGLHWERKENKVPMEEKEGRL